MSFGSDPGRDEGGLPPVNVVIPDDARELDRDVLAYRREQRAIRRRARLVRLFRPLRALGLGGHGAILPLIATCVALSMLAGAMLSVVTISPASAPTVSPPARPGTSASPLPADATGLTRLPAGTFTVEGTTQPVDTIKSAALALVPANCACDDALRRLAGQAGDAHVGLYFVGEGGAIQRIQELTARDGAGIAAAAADTSDILGAVYHPADLTILLVYSDTTARVFRNPSAGFYLGPALRGLTRPGR